jgi:hypothetical protein
MPQTPVGGHITFAPLRQRQFVVGAHFCDFKTSDFLEQRGDRMFPMGGELLGAICAVWRLSQRKINGDGGVIGQGLVGRVVEF